METKTFAELGLSAKVQQAIIASGYTIPTPIQEHAIPVAMAGRDVLGIAQTGTGKTASFTLPMISRLETGRARARMPRSLILAPTRELAAQVAQSFEKYGINHKLDVALLIGGVSMDEQTKKLDRGVDVLIATPGRLLDHFQRGRIMLMGVEILVIDEADRMLDMGFIPDIEKICKLLPPRKQTLFFSATMPPEITRLTQQFLNDPVRIEVAPPATSAKTITQAFAYCGTGEDWAKRDTLRTLLRGPGVRNAIIFANRKVEVAILLKSLVKHGFNAGAIHGDMDQKSRTETLDKFRNGEIAFLVGSDVAARGLDIPDVSHVFNYDLPRDKDDYVHRIGRTGRAGKEGHSLSLVTPFDLKQLQELEKMSGEPAVWVGDAPTEQDYADAGKKKRGRTSASLGAGVGASVGGARTGARPGGGRERPMPVRSGARNGESSGARPAESSGARPAESSGARPAESSGAHPAASGGAPRISEHGSAGRGERRPRPGAGGSRHGRPREVEEPIRREVLNTGQRRAQRDDAIRAPGFEPQPDMMSPVRPLDGGPGEAARSQQNRPQQNRPQHSRPPRDRGANERPPQRVRSRGGHGPAEESSERGPRRPEGRAEPHADTRPEPRVEARLDRDPVQRTEPRAPAPARDPRPQGEQRDARAQPQARTEQPRRVHPNRGNGGDGGGNSSFADNVPAFLQRPVRPAKAVSD